MKLSESVTFKNLAAAYAGECMANTRYKFVEYGFRYNGFVAIAGLISKVVYQEFNHARMLYTAIQGCELKQVDNIDIEAGFPFKEKWDMEANLKLLAEDEHDEALNYKNFIDIANEEGFSDIATLFKQIMEVEIKHKNLFKELYNQFSSGTLYSKDKEVEWYCPHCGYSEMGKKAWNKCPLCEAEQGVCEIILPKNICI